MELKSLVKKLLALSKHLFKQQNEMLETFKVIHSDLGTAGTSLSKDGTGEKVKIIRNSLNETKTSGMAEDVEKHWPSNRGLVEEDINEWYTHILPREEAKLQRIENKWRRLRMNPNKGTEDRRLPLDLLKSHFAQILAKSSSPVLGKTSRISSSSSESTLSLDSFSDEDEKEVQPEKELHNLQNLYLSMPSASWCCSTNLPTADNLHSLCGTLNIDSKSINHADRELSKICSHYESKFGKKTKDLKKKSTPIKSSTTAKVMVQEVEDTSLQSLFERNPELRQEGKTCLILEVLEPSSSENEENSKIKKTTKNSGGCRIEKNYNRNSSVQSDKDYKVWASSRQKLMSSHPKFSSGDISFSLNSREKKLGPDESRENVLMDTVLHSGKSQHHYDPSTLERNMLNVHLFSEDKTKCKLSVQDAMLNAHLSQETQVKTIDGGSSGFHEPDLIRETKVKSISLSASNHNLNMPQKLGKTSWKAHNRRSEVKSTHSNINQSINKQLSTIVKPSSKVTIPSEYQVNTAKMKGFLSKLSLKGKWALKHKSQTPKKLDEISADEFQDMYSRSVGVSESKDHLIVPDFSTVSSQDPRIINSTKEETFFKKSSCAPSQTYITEDTTTCKQSFLDDQNTGGVCAPSAERSNTSSQLLRLEELPSVLLPPRREPPPAPPTLQRSGRDVKDAIWSSAESGPLQESLEGASTCNTPLVSIVLQGQKHSKVSNTTSFSVHIKDCQIQQPFIVSSKPNSLSRIDSSPHAEDNENSSEFPLTKTFSTLIEVLLTPDSSTAGRQSPAPSEVSKTESALSPPIDVSKTEITKPHNLGKIEETVKREASCLTTGPMEVKTAATVDIIRLPTTDNGDDKITTGHESDSEVKSNFPELEHRKVNKANYGVSAEMTGKPWYDVSDEDDILSPGRYCLTVIGSSDDDREASSS